MRLIRFQMKRLLPVLLLIAVGKTSRAAEPVESQAAAIAAIEKLGGRVTFRDNALVKVSLRGSQVTDASLEHIKQLTSLQTIGLNHSKVTDAGLVHLKGLECLKTLYLVGTSVSDDGLEHVKEMTELVNLYLHDTRVTDAGLEHLSGLDKLRVLYVTKTQVTASGVRKLQQSLPRCSIKRDANASRRQSKSL